MNLPAPFVSSDIKADESNDCHIMPENVIHNHTHNITTLALKQGTKQSGSGTTKISLNIYIYINLGFGW